MAIGTGIASNSSVLSSKLKFGNLASAFKGVSSSTATTIVLDDATGLSGTSLYSASRPGQVIVIEGVAAGDKGKTANITAITGSTLTVNVDLTTALDDSSVIMVVPPLSVQMFESQGNSLEVTAEDDETMGLTETFLTHNTRLGTKVGGDIPLFVPNNSVGLGRALAAAVGGYKAGATQTYRPFKADDATFTQSDDFTVFVQDGNGVHRQIFGAMFCTGFTLAFPQNAIATFSMSTIGAAVAREVGGSGKTFSTGTNNWDNVTTCDTGSRYTFTAVFVQFGGAFGAALDKDAAETTIQSLTIAVERGTPQDTVLGNEYILKPIEDMQKITVTGARIFETDARRANYYGAGNAAPGAHDTTRMLIKAIHPADSTKTLTVDIPLGKLKTTITRQRTRVVEQFTYTGIQTLNGSGCIDTANPLYQIQYVSGISTDFLAAL